METGTIILLVVLGIVGLLALITVLSSFFTVKQAEAVVIERFGKFARVANSGLNFKTPFIERLARRVDLRVQQFSVTVETKTKDNVFVKIPVSIQYSVLVDKIRESVYKLSNVQQQITSYVFNIILGHVPSMTLDETFTSQANIALEVKKSLDESMLQYGFSVDKALITDVIPDEKVKEAMNDINAAQREQVAATARGEGAKILAIKNAEADAESKKLQGEGIANQRKAIIEGLRESVEHFKESVEGASATDVMALVLVTQYFDTMKEIGSHSGTSTLFFPSQPGAANDMLTQITAGFKTSQIAKAASAK